MTEIHVQKKKKPVWPWVVGLILIVVVILLLVDNGAQKKAEMAVTEREIPEEVTDYILYVRQTDASDTMNIHHEYTSEGIQKLASALEALVDEINSQEVEMDEKKDRLNQIADYIQKNPQQLTHSDSIRAAFELASDIIVTIQQAHFPEVSEDVQNLQSAATAVNPGTPTLDQSAQIEGFFEESASALDALAQRMTITEIAAAKIVKTKKG
ncbi:MAG: hypothetical protein M3Q58_04535 [Bacteroidota bacterium]|nr:hypothetical protein [Bacteroidota bacterium]